MASPASGDDVRRLGRRLLMGTSRFDPVTGQNVPYTIAGDAVADHLSFLHESSLAPTSCSRGWRTSIAGRCRPDSAREVEEVFDRALPGPLRRDERPQG